jgi:purine-nucleoside phosphorylase
MLKKIKESISFIKEKVPIKPQIGIILGTGLGGLTKEINIKYSIPYTEIPNFPIPTVEGHQGKLIFGTLNGKNVVAMQGRFHFYEGYSLDEITFPIRVLKYLGIELLILSNASGGLNNDFEIGDIMIITDHINLVSNPLIGKNEPEFGPRFVDMSEAYNKKIINKATIIARHNSIKYQSGVYACVSGPTYETPAEYKYIQSLGADAVGMSTVPEVIVARHMNITCFAMSIISDLGVPGKIIEVTHNDVIDVANNVEPKMTVIIKGLIGTI